MEVVYPKPFTPLEEEELSERVHSSQINLLLASVSVTHY